MTLEELDRELLSDEERLVSSLREREAAKEALKASRVALRKARITSISNKLLAPYRRFRIEKVIAKYDAMIERIEKEQEKQRVKEEKLRQKEAKKEAKADFKAAIRDKRKEDIVNFINDRKDDVVSFANDKKSDVIDFSKGIASEVSDTLSYIKEVGGSKVSMASSFVSNVKNSAIKKVRENTTIDLTIKNAIEDVKLKYTTNKYNKAVENKAKEEEKAKEQELNDAINFDEGVKIELKERDVPFSNINEKIQKTSKKSSYMGKATNRVVRYFKSKKDNVMDTINDKVAEAQFNMSVNAYKVMGKVSKAKSEVKIVFNNELNDLKTNVVDRYNDVKRDIKDKANSVSYAYREAKEKNETERVNKEQSLAIKRAQLENMRQALESVNNTGDVFDNAPSLDAGRAMK